MNNWVRQFIPWLLVISLGANLWLAVAVWDRDSYANRVTWGNMISDLSKYASWAHSDGSLNSLGITNAQETLELLQSLPHANARIDFQDRQVIYQFLSYANRSASVAQQEVKAGGLSADSERRWEMIKQGLWQIAVHAETANRLKTSAHPWNHAEWKAMFRQMSRDLQQLDLVPLE